MLGLEGLGVRAIASSAGMRGTNKTWGEFAGVKSCKECHPTAYKIWKNSKHAHATEALGSRRPIPRGSPTRNASVATSPAGTRRNSSPTPPALSAVEATPELAGNTCENCHGPSAAHVAAENGKDYAKREEQRALVRLTKAQAEQNVCIKCHDLDNSPNFSKPGASTKTIGPRWSTRARGEREGGALPLARS